LERCRKDFEPKYKEEFEKAQNNVELLLNHKFHLNYYNLHPIFLNLNNNEEERWIEVYYILILMFEYYQNRDVHQRVNV
jgi:hypothetical protein